MTTGIRVRGFGGGDTIRALLLVNGVVTNDPYLVGIYRTEFAFNLASVERIEIVRGPASASTVRVRCSVS